MSGAPAPYEWKTMRLGMTALSDDDWADDESDALPTLGVKPISFEMNPAVGKTSEVEFVVLGYVAATLVVSDNDADTFSVDVTLLVQPPKDSVIGTGATNRSRSGNAAGDRRVAIRHASTALFRFFEINRFECSGADQVVLRLHTASGAPGAADRYEVWYREITK